MLYLLIVLIGGVLSYFAPWWIIAPVCFILCWWLARKPAHAFWVSAFAAVTLWLGYAVYLQVVTGSGLADNVAAIFTGSMPVLTDMPGIVIVMLVVTLVIAPVAGFSGLAGVQMKRLIHPPR